MAVYRHFRTVRTALYGALAGIILLGASPMAQAAASRDDLYTVENVEVDITAANAVEARTQALDAAQVKAYHMLAEKFYTPEQMASFVDPDPLLVSSMVQDFEVTNEQLSKVRYKGVFTVRFRPSAVRKYLPVDQYDGMRASTMVPTLVLPYYRYGDRTILWDKANIWLQSWSNPDIVSEQQDASEQADPVVQHTAAMDENIIVPIGDLLDVSQMPDDKALTYDPQMLDQMMGRYAADQAVILIAVPKSGNPDALEISLYDARRTGPVFAQSVMVEGRPGEHAAALYTRAVQQVGALLHGNWKQTSPAGMVQNGVQVNPMNAVNNAVDGPAPGTAGAPTSVVAGPATQFDGRVMFSSVQEWVKLKNALERTPGMRSVVVKGLKPREAQIMMSYAGDAVALATAMQRAGIMMRSVSGQQAGYYPGQAGPAIYEFSSAGAPRY